MKWICIPKNQTWDERKKRSAVRCGFFWDGVDMAFEGNTRPAPPWGCKVLKYKPPAPPKKGFGAAVGILVGSHDEYGKPLK